jgi:hypothetical protein
MFAVAGLALVLTIGITGRSAESSSRNQVGRYQLVAGCYDSAVREGLADRAALLGHRTGIFKIDTVTGQTWVYREVIDTQSIIEDQYVREWIPID